MIKNKLNQNNSIIVISSIKQAKKLKINNYNLPILCMSANIFFFFKKKNSSDKIHLIKFQLNKKDEEICIDSIKDYFDKFKTFKKNSISLSAFETTKILLLKNLYSVTSINLFLSKFTSFYYFNQNKFDYTNSKELVIDSIFRSNQDEYSFKRKSQIQNTFKFIYIFINNFIFFLNKNKKMIWIISKKKPIKIFLQEINKNIVTNDNLYAYYYYKNNNLFFLKLIKSIFCSIFKKNTIIPIFQVKKKDTINKDFIKLIISSFLTDNLKAFDNIIFKNIIKSIEDASSIENYTYELLNKYNFHLLITDQIRWKDGTGVAAAFKRKIIPVFLVSHNTHTLSNTEKSDKIQFQNAYGLLYSELSSYDVVQSHQAFLFYKKYFDETKIIRSSPIMWGYSKLNNKNENNGMFTIILADTIKKFYTIPYIYEDSFGYLNNIIEILDRLEEIDNIKKIVKFRSDQNLSSNLINKIVKKYKNTHVSIKESFLDVIKDSNLLISHSSTTIEEALNLNIPVGLYIGKNHYQHILNNNINNHEFIFKLNKNNIKEIVKKIYINANKLKNKNYYNKTWVMSNKELIIKLDEYCK